MAGPIFLDNTAVIVPPAVIDVVRPEPTADNQVLRSDGIAGAIQGSPVTMTDLGAASGFTDITATALDVAGQAYPESFAGRTMTPIAGKSLLPVLKGGTREGHAALGWATSGSQALRIGQWKLVAAKDGPWELYDLEKDRTELHDLAAEQPDRVAAMAGAFTAWSAK
jgi:hypothetical protein